MRTRKVGKLALIVLLVFSMAVGSVSPAFAMESGPLDTETEPIWQEVEEALISAVGNTDAEIQSSKTYRKTELVKKITSGFFKLEETANNLKWASDAADIATIIVGVLKGGTYPAAIVGLFKKLHDYFLSKYEFFNVNGYLQVTRSTYKSYDVNYRTGKRTLIGTYTVITYDIYEQLNSGRPFRTDSRTYRHK